MKKTFQILLSESRQAKAKALLKENKFIHSRDFKSFGYADISHFHVLLKVDKYDAK
jgi:hypothetical protein